MEAVLFTGAGLLALLLGSWVPDVRLVVAGIPVNTVVLAALAVMATFSTIRKQVIYLACLIQAPLLVAFVAISWSPDPEYGLDKFSTLLVTGNICFLLFNSVIERFGLKVFARTLLGFLSLLLLAALVYKSIFGFYNRTIIFFMNGPIVFARLMGIAAILSFFAFNGKSRPLIVGLFVLAVFWTESKGPILAIILTISFAAFGLAKKRNKIIVAFAFALLALGIHGISKYIATDISNLGRTSLLFSLAAGNIDILSTNSASASSTKSRIQFWEDSVEMIGQEPFGVGLGGWNSAAPRHGVDYPHNLFLEILTECGVLIGSLAIIPFVIFLLARKSAFYYISTYLLLAQMVSGDLGDARMLLVFSLLATLSLSQESV